MANIGYARISKPQIKGTNAQIEALKQQDTEVQHLSILNYLKTHNKVLHRYHPVETSATKKIERRGILDVIASLQEGDTLLVVSIDRLARDITQLHTIMRAIRERGAGLTIIDAPTLSFAPGSKEGDPMVDFLLSILGAVSQYELKLISVRTKRGLEYARAQGKRLGAPAYAVARNAKRCRQEADKRAKALGPIFREMVKSGLTHRQMVDRLNHDKVPTARGGTWHLSQVQRVLNRLK